MKRRLAVTVVGLGITAAIAGCGGSAIKQAPKAVDLVLNGGRDIGTFVTHVQPHAGTVHDAAAGLADVSGSTLAIKAKLDRIAASDDPLGETLVLATCQGLSQVADEDRDSGGDVLSPSVQDWQRYLNEQVQQLAPAYAGEVSSRVDQFNDAAQLAAINPRAAHTYVEACVLGKR